MAAIQDYLGNVLKGTANGDGTFSISGGSGGGGAVTVADGADVTQGSIADAGVKDAAGTINAHLRGLIEVMLGGAVAVGAAAAGTAASGNPVLIAGEDATTAVRTVATDASGNVQVVGPKIQGTSTTFAPQVVAGTSGAAQTGTVQALVVSTAGAAKVDGSAVTQPVSASSLPLPTGAATAANQTVVGTAGAPSTQVVSVQGVGGGTVLPVVASINDGTTLANNVAAPDSGQGAQLVAGSRKEVAFTTTTAQAVATTDCSNYRSVAVTVSSMGVGATASFQVSNDNTNWFPLPLLSTNSTGQLVPLISITVTASLYAGPIQARYFRINVTGISSGTSAGLVEFFSSPYSSTTMAVVASQTGTWSVQALPAAQAAGGYSYNHMAGAATTTIKSGAGTLNTISINTKGAASTATVFDSTTGSGTIIAVVDLTLGQDTLTYNLAFATGLTIVTTGTLSDLTVTYK